MKERIGRIGLWLLIPVLLFGIFIGLLMTWHHDQQLFGSGIGGELVGCVESAEVNCDAVNTSDYSEMFGIPIATFAVPFYGGILALVIQALRRKQGARALVIVAGVGAVLYAVFLFYISKTQLGFVCAWCLRSYLVNLAILVLALLGGRPSRPDAQILVTSGAIFLGLLLVAVGGEKLYRSSLMGGAAIDVAKGGAKTEKDPQGDAPSLTFTVKTEDNRDATLTLEADDPWIGNKDSSVAVVTFGDFECGYCKRTEAEISRLVATYGDRVLFIFKHYPMDPACNAGVKNRRHPEACLAAKASVCAGEQERFWAFHELAFKNQHQLGSEYLKTYATQVGADAAKFDACMASDAALQVVRKDAEAGTALDIHGTPRVYIDGKWYRSGTSAEVMARAIEMALSASSVEAAERAASLRETTGAATAISADVPPMREVRLGDFAFRIDSFEAAVRDGQAVSGKHEVPALRSSWFDAKAACEKAGKRLCTEEEWVSACQGARAVDDNNNGQYADDLIEGTTYPYGDLHDDGRCWDDKLGDEFRPVYTGEMPGCATPTGVYDMTGNLEEWVGATPETAVLVGGAWDTKEDHARCYRRNDTFGAGYSSNRTGFRCCAD